MYQVIYSSVVVFSAILTWLFMGRILTMIQWAAIIGTSVGLGVSSLDSFQPIDQDFAIQSSGKYHI
jgi:drug/metabolite transporter (DMT)-like permease